MSVQHLDWENQHHLMDYATAFPEHSNPCTSNLRPEHVSHRNPGKYAHGTVPIGIDTQGDSHTLQMCLSLPCTRGIVASRLWFLSYTLVSRLAQSIMIL